MKVKNLKKSVTNQKLSSKAFKKLFTKTNNDTI